MPRKSYLLSAAVLLLPVAFVVKGWEKTAEVRPGAPAPSMARIAAASSMPTAPAPIATVPPPAKPAVLPLRPVDGIELELRAIPEFTRTVFMPLLPAKENFLKLGNRPIDEVVEVPAGYTLLPDRGGVRISAPEGDEWGYARVRSGGEELTLTLVNIVPYDAMRDGRLDGFRIGEYMTKPLRGLSTYRVPEGFVRLTREKEQIRVSDNYTLRDFQCKQEGVNKFLIVRPEALIKLELLQHELTVKEKRPIRKFTVMSAYRTPHYNASIGNKTKYSRHLYGDAIDVYVDENGDSVMDDVNRDGRIDQNDARYLLQLADRIDRSPEWSWLKGGAGTYRANAAHGPFLHIDTRGYVTRW